MTENKRYLLRKPTGDLLAENEQGIQDWFQKGQCKPGDLLYDFSQKTWSRVGGLPALASAFGPKPSAIPEKRLVYYMAPGPVPVCQGPFSTKEIQQKIQAKEICENSWVFVDGDKEWRQVRQVKVLLDMLTALPIDEPPVIENSPSLVTTEPSNPSISLVIESAEQAGENREEVTMAISNLGLSLKTDHTTPPTAAVPPPLNRAGVPPPAVPPRISYAPVGSDKDQEQGSFDGITAEIPIDPIWLIKRASSEAVSGPFRFLEVIKFLQEGSLNKNDKISKVGTNRFVKIQQQYEFNVNYSVETVVEHGVERQKILIKRRHPRVPYFTGVQVMGKQGLLVGNCVNISAGGILMEIPKADFNLGDVLEIKILPGMITRSINCRSLVIGKIPKIPPGFALKFEDLKLEDKEAIEFYVQETLKREMKQS